MSLEPRKHPPHGHPTRPEQRIRAGDMLAGHYRVERMLGRGGMGVVVLARDLQLDRDVAIKVIRPELMSNGETRQKFLQEARTMARVRHPNVVDVDYFGLEGIAPYFVMEYVPGTTLDVWVAERRSQEDGGPSIDEALGLIYQCCRGVAAIHEAGATHGDLKPANLLLSRDARLVITDLGLARLLDGDELAQTAGTPAYLAPEALDPTDDPELAKRQDVYSLGVIAYELLTGERPFDILSAESFYQAVRRPPLPASRRRPGLPSSFDAPLAEALQARPQQRTPDADTLRRALVRARRSARTSARPVRLLVVDDDPEFITLVKAVLSANFPTATVITAENGSRALDLIERESLDLLVVDLRMPEVNGVAVVAALRAIDPDHRIPVVVATAEGGAKDWQLLRSMGADAFLAKPFDPEALVSEVGRLLARTPQGSSGTRR